MTEKMTPKEPERVACEICMKEIPVDEANSVEGSDYVFHFCGLECFEKWQHMQPPRQESDT
jgi:hypothetical protein